MKFANVQQVNEFLEIVGDCEGSVFLTSQEGDKFNLKSAMSQYIAMGALLGQKGEELELWCDNKDDEAKFLKFLGTHPEVR